MKLALCNEVLRALPFDAQCASAAALGYAGLELAPFTLAADPSMLAEADAQRLRRSAASHGLALPSLHWLMVQPPGLSIATPDAALHARSIAFLAGLVRFAAACGATRLVHGSPAQRAPAPGQTVADALARCEAAWAQLAEIAAEHGVVYCIEPLAPFETPVLNTLAEVARTVERIGSPALRSMLDLSAASHAEPDDAATLVRRHLPGGLIAHVQLNDHNRRGPGQGATPVRPALQALHELGYDGWLAVEPFDYVPDGPGCAAFGAGYVRGLLESLQ